MKMIMMLNRKGGVAKTTNVVAIARCFAAAGKRVLLIDADHQCTASELLLGTSRFCACDSARHTLHDLLAKMLESGFDPAVTERFCQSLAVDKGSLDVLPCSARIEEFQTNRARAKGKFHTTEEFRRAWSKNANAFRTYITKSFDYAFIDCPPSLALQVGFFLRISHGYILPCVPEHLSVSASVHLIERLKDLGYSRIVPLGLIWSKVKGIADHKALMEDVRKRTPPYDVLPEPFETTISDSIEIQRSTNEIPPDASSSFKSIYKGKAKQIIQLCNEIVKRSKGKKRSKE